MKKSLILITLFSLLLFGCSRGALKSFNLDDGGAYFGRAGFAETAYAFAEPELFRGRVAATFSGTDFTMEYDQPVSSDSANLTNSERKLVKSATIRIRVENLEDADASIVNLMEKYNGYSASTTIWENSYNYSLRVPSHLYDIFLAEVNSMGRMIHRTENVEDVTLRYYDLEGRLESRRELLRTFQSYLGRANNIDEILSVETRITDLQREIDHTGTQLRNLANQIDYASIHLELTGPVTSYPNRSETSGERIKLLFGNFGNFLSSLMVILLGIIIYGIPILLLLALFYLILFGKIGLLKKLWDFIATKRKT